MFEEHKNILKGVVTLGFNPLKNISENTENAGIELFGNKRMIVLDCKYVVDFSEESVVLNLGNLNMKVRGANLVISSFCYGQTDITGEIVTIEFERA
jgi:sporulation protein YqfC